MPSIAFTGGGTGGHIYPGLAVVSRIMEKTECRVFWIGSRAELDRSIVEKAGITFFGIPSGKFRRNCSLRNFSDLFRVAAGFFAARKILAREKPAALFSKGGFVSVPPCAAAASLGIPVFTHESDYSPGLATRLNARFTSGGKIITSYAETAARFPRKYRGRVCFLGNPVRPEFRNAGSETGRAFAGVPEGEKMLLALGGSQGAVELNELIRLTLPELTKHFVVVHQTGPNNETPPSTDRYKAFPYIKDELPSVLAAADLVVGRSGAGTVWECAAAGKPMILVPLAGAGTRGDQLENARFFEKAGAAEVIGAEHGSAENKAAVLRDAAVRIAGNGAARAAMAAASAALGRADAAERIAGAVLTAVFGDTGVSGAGENGAAH